MKANEAIKETLIGFLEKRMFLPLAVIESQLNHFGWSTKKGRAESINKSANKHNWALKIVELSPKKNSVSFYL